MPDVNDREQRGESRRETLKVPPQTRAAWVRAQGESIFAPPPERDSAYTSDEFIVNLPEEG